jgi:hypothetical protein
MYRTSGHPFYMPEDDYVSKIFPPLKLESPSPQFNSSPQFSSPSSDTLQARKLFIGGLPLHATNDDVCFEVFLLIAMFLVDQMFLQIWRGD